MKKTDPHPAPIQVTLTYEDRTRFKDYCIRHRTTPTLFLRGCIQDALDVEAAQQAEELTALTEQGFA